MNDTNTSSPAEQTDASEPPEYNNQANPSEGLAVILSMECLQPNPYKTRLIFPEQELQALASSIAELGLIEPVAVRKVGDFSYQIIAGERRFRAFKLLNRSEIPCQLFLCSDADMALMAAAENMDRQDLSDYEKAKTLRNIENQFMDRANLAESLGMNREDMYRYYAFEALPEFLLEKLETNPRLLSRKSASDIKSVLSKAPAEQNELAASALKEALDLLEAGKLEQSKMADFISRKLKAVNASASRSKDALLSQGKKAGYFLTSSNGTTIHFAAGVLSDEQNEAAKTWANQMINPQ